MTRLFAALAVFSLLAAPTLAGQCSSSHQAVKHHTVVVHQQAAPQATSAEEKEEADIVETASSIKDFSTLVAAVKAAGLVEALKGEGPFTVFAPTDEAFKKLPEGTLESLLKPENKEKLTNILLYHVVPGKVLAEDVVKLETAETLLKDKSVKIKVKEGEVFIDKSQVIKTDVTATNGVIHVIDSVLLP